MKGKDNYSDWSFPFGKLRFLLTHSHIFNDYVLVGKGDPQDVENFFDNQKLVETTTKETGATMGAPFVPHTSLVYLKKLFEAYKNCVLSPTASKILDSKVFASRLHVLVSSLNNNLPDFNSKFSIPLQTVLVEIWPSKEKTEKK